MGFYRCEIGGTFSTRFLFVEICGHGSPCPYKSAGKARGKTKMIFSAFPIRLLQLSAAGEVFLEGTCPLSRCPQTAKLPAPYFRRTGKVGEKSDSFSRAERTRPLRPVSRLLYRNFGNVPVERFQRILPLLKSADTAQPVPTMCTEHLANCAQLDQPDESNDLVSLCPCTMRFVMLLFRPSCQFSQNML